MSACSYPGNPGYCTHGWRNIVSWRRPGGLTMSCLRYSSGPGTTPTPVLKLITCLNKSPGYMYGKLSIQQAPPLSVPARFFLTAPVFGMVAALILLFTGKDLLSSRWTPGMLAVTHCLTLGFFTSVMIGAT